MLPNCGAKRKHKKAETFWTLSRSCHFATPEDTDRKYGNRIRLPGSKKECESIPVENNQLLKLLCSSGCGGGVWVGIPRNGTWIRIQYPRLSEFSSCSKCPPTRTERAVLSARPHCDVNSPDTKEGPSESIYHPINALRERPFVTYINCYMFRHRRAIFRVIIAKAHEAPCQYITHLRQQWHNSKSVIFQEKSLKVLKCYNFLLVQRRHNCSPAASFANCVMTLYLLKVHLQTFLSISMTQKCRNFELWHSCWKWAIYFAPLSKNEWNIKMLQYIRSITNCSILILNIKICYNNQPHLLVISCFYIMWIVCIHIKCLYTSCT